MAPRRIGSVTFLAQKAGQNPSWIFLLTDTHELITGIGGSTDNTGDPVMIIADTERSWHGFEFYNSSI